MLPPPPQRPCSWSRAHWGRVGKLGAPKPVAATAIHNRCELPTEEEPGGAGGERPRRPEVADRVQTVRIELG
ncbi:MAG: Thioredoxin reductase [uncultured Acetobacteraceae bacterium]|uniref:Thioredoxin reductase n=1 Tax=uncultured Acetobacteraceae bacterium TaxID=169975 RepID=A0A6J4IH11_9PROT|nr:MAG: Thioredoxin reductase [uncultured Acetobacteraceae bacterium]